MMIKKILLASLLFLFAIPANGQTDLNIDSLKSIIDKGKMDTTYVKVALQLSDYYTRKDMKQALLYSKLAKKGSEKINSQADLCRSYLYMGNIYMNFGALDSARILVNNALKIAKKENLERDEAALYSTLGHLEKSENRNDKALEYYLKAVKICENSKSESVQRNAPAHLNNVAIILRSEGKYQKALEYITKAYDISKKYENELYQSVFISTKGRIYTDLKAYDKALPCLEEAYRLKEKIGDKLGTVPLVLSIAIIHTQRKDYALADDFYQKGIALAKSLNYVVALVDFQYQKAYSEFMRGNYLKATEAAEESIKMAKSIDKKDEMLLSYDLLIKCYEKTGQFEKGFQTQKLYLQMRDSITLQEQQKHIEELETIYKVEKQERENEILKTEQVKNKIIIRQRNYIIFGATMAILLLTISAILLSKAYKTKAAYGVELEAKNEKLNELDIAKTQFFANVSHEFKTPLTLIISPLKQLLKSKTLDESHQYLIDTAARNSLQLLDITNQILDLTKIEKGFENLMEKDFDFTELVHSTVANFQSLAINQNVYYVFDYQGVTPLWIVSDDYKIKTILKNLISNAFKFTKESGRVTVLVSEKEKTLEIVVQDNGQGIHEYDIPFVFDRFYQSKNQTTIVKGGTGIGLAICKEYTKTLGGDIRLSSKWGEGSTFTVTIPKKMSTQSYQPISLTPTNLVIEPKQSSFQAHLPTILVAEDNLDMQSYIDFILKPYYNVVIVPNGKIALQTLTAGEIPIDLLISDLMMPVMDGYELLENIKKRPNLAKLPTIMLTALNNKETRLKAFRIGINDYISKPFDAEELLLRIEHLLDFQKERVMSKEVIAEEDAAEVMSDLSGEDEEWLEKLENFCLSQMNNTNFKAKDLADEMLVSYTHFWRKLQALIGMTPSQYLQEVRFREARKLIEERKFATVKQVAYAVGFKDERNFSRNFKKRFGKIPSEFMN